MPISVGTRIGVYEIVAAIGAGGMGEVYRARDQKLNRDVALKVLPEPFAEDSERLARFRREAQLLAALNHPNIAHIHGFEDADASTSSGRQEAHALVMEFVPGVTLAERMTAGPIPLAESLAIAQQVASALEAAHAQSIVHRDLKPANIKISDDGVVKVLDFGLAKALETDLAGAPATSSPTITSPAMTRAGLILGTAAYMSPEQARGRAVDARSDVWAFGAVLYEMLSGRRAFPGEEIADTLASVLKSEPDWTALPSDVPASIHALLRRCLAKDVRQRVSNISTASYVISEPAASDVTHSSATGRDINGLASSRSIWRRTALPIAAALVAGAAVGAAVWPTSPPLTPRVTRFALSPAGTQSVQIDSQSTDVMLTADGAMLVYKGGADAGVTQLFLRPLDALEPTPLTTPGAPKAPFASPDGQWVGFFEPGPPVALKKVAITGGPAQLLTSFDGASRGATWGDDGSIIFATTNQATGLYRVSSSGGEPTVLTRPNRERGEYDHLYPRHLPGSRTVLFTITSSPSTPETALVAALDLETLEQKILVRGGSQAFYVSSGHLVYVAAGALRAVRFDLERLEVVGTAVPAVSELVILPSGTADFDLTRSGTLAYVVGGTSQETSPRTLVWVDRTGQEEIVRGAAKRPYLGPRLSPDGTKLAVSISDQSADIWVWDFARETLTRVTTDPGTDQTPIWMPDGKRLVFSSQADGSGGSLFVQAADGSGSAQRLTEQPARPSGVLADGLRILSSMPGGPTGVDVMTVSLADRRVEPIVQTPFIDANGEVSPDGKWLAYQTNDSGSNQIVARPFPNVNDGKFVVSNAGGIHPRWARNGQELFYVAPSGALMGVAVGRGSGWATSPPNMLVQGKYYMSNMRGGAAYDVSPDGKRFLLMKSSDAAAPASLVVVQNWGEELKRLLP